MKIQYDSTLIAPSDMSRNFSIPDNNINHRASSYLTTPDVEFQSPLMYNRELKKEE